MDFPAFKYRFQKKEPEHFSNKVGENPMVSVLVQTFQHEKYISQCLDAILAQETDFDYEILLGEDNSRDSTREICIEYAQKYPEKIRLFLHHHENKIMVNGITTGNFNALYNFFNAKGKYIAFSEGDDYWNDPSKLQKQVNFLKDNHKYSLSYHSFEILTKEAIIDDRMIEQPTSDISREELKHLKMHPLLSTVCFRNDFQQLPKEMAEVINVDSFLLSLLGNFGGGKFMPGINPSFYRKHRGGIWTGRLKENKYYSKIRTYKKLIEYYRIKDDQVTTTYFRRELDNTYKMIFYFFLMNGRLYKAFKLSPRIINSLLSQKSR